MEHNFKNHYRELAEKIETGEYFVEAQEWYAKRYLYNFIERTYLLVLIGGIIFLSFMMLSYYFAILPLRKNFLIPVNITSAAEQSTRITYLGTEKKDFDVNDVIIKYFSERFVQAIESYDYRNDFRQLRINRNMIETLSNEDILSYYTDKVSIRNRDSLIIKYKKNVIRLVTVDSKKIEIAPVEDEKKSDFEYFTESRKNQNIKSYEVTVNFEALEIDKSGKRSLSKWQSKISLSFQTIAYNFKEQDFSPLNYKVTSYESKRID